MKREGQEINKMHLRAGTDRHLGYERERERGEGKGYKYSLFDTYILKYIGFLSI